MLRFMKQWKRTAALVLAAVMLIGEPLSALAAEGFTFADEAMDFVPAEAAETAVPEEEEAKEQGGSTAETESVSESASAAFLESIPTATPSVASPSAVPTGFVLEFTYGEGQRREVADNYYTSLENDHMLPLCSAVGDECLYGAQAVSSDHEEFIAVTGESAGDWTVHLIAPFDGMARLSLLMSDGSSKEIGIRYRRYDKTLYWAYGDGVLRISTKEISGEYEASGNGSLNVDDSSVPWESLKSSITQVIVGGEEDIVEPKNTYDWFSGMQNLTFVDLRYMEGVIGDFMFYQCSSLETVDLSDHIQWIGNHAFRYSGLKNIRIPQDVYGIGSSAFYGSKLKRVELPDSVERVDAYAFDADSFLYAIIPDSVRFLENDVFGYNGCIVCSDAAPVASMPEYADRCLTTEKCTGKAGRNMTYRFDMDTRTLTLSGYGTPYTDFSFVGKGYVKRICFENYTSATLPAFKDFGSLTEIGIPESVTALPNSAFENCSDLEEIEIPDNVTHIGGYAFANCEKLREVDLPEKLTELEYGAFYGCILLESMEIPSGVSYPGGGLFEGCTSLREVVLHEGLQGIQYNVFKNCTALASIGIPEGVISISNEAFMGCASLSEVVLPGSMQCIYEKAFAGCPALQSVTIPWATREIAGTAFEYSDNVTLRLYSGSYAEAYAIYEGIDYEVIGEAGIPILYELDGGENSGNNPARFLGSETVWLEAPSKKGYNFSGWYLDSTFNQYVYALYSDSYYGDPITLYAKWDLVTYHVFYDTNGGQNSPYNPETYSIEQGVTRLFDARREGYRFLGWFTDDTYTEQITEIPADTGRDVNLYALWEEIRYPITYELNGGQNSGANPEWYSINSKGMKLASPYRAGYDFAGWYEDEEFMELVTWSFSEETGPKTFYAKWIPVSYVVKFDGNGKTSGTMSSQYRLYDSGMELSPNGFKRTGYTFDGWNTMADGTGVSFENGSKKEVMTVTGTVKLYAQWKKVKYKITYELNGGKNSSSNKTSYYVTTSDFTLKNPTRSGYAFEGWYTDAKLTKKASATIKKGSTGDKKFYAKWTSFKYNIKFSANGGKGSMSTIKDLKDGASKTLPACKFTRSGYVFAGWNTKKDGTGTAFKDKATVKSLASKKGETVTLYAQWSVKTFNVSFNANGGTGSMSKLSKVAYGKSKKLTANAFKKTGYTFAGWNTRKDGSGIALADKADIKSLACPSGSTVTLYAQWTPAEYKITYSLNGGKNSSKNPDVYTVVTASFTLASATKEGYTFSGWYSDSKFKTKVTKISKGSTGSKKLYAKWTAKKYKITYELDGGTNNKENPSTYTIATAFSLKAPQKKNYSFKGWFADKGYLDAVTGVEKGTTGDKTFYAKWGLGGWVKDEKGFYYQDRYGYKVYNEWKKDGSNYYYLGDDGYMVTNTLVDYDGRYYWCGADGAKVANVWVRVPADSEDILDLGVNYRWYYFDSAGRAYANKKATINGKTRFFDTFGKLLFGYVDDQSFTMTTNTAEAIQPYSPYRYYCGTLDEGYAYKSVWKQETITNDYGPYEDRMSFWTFYKSNGVRATANDVTGILWDNERYYFDEAGKMLTGWQRNPDGTVSYFGDANDGKMHKKTWVYARPINGQDDGKEWFYLDGAGRALNMAGVYNINGKFYAFGAPQDGASKALSGFVALTAAEDMITDATNAARVRLNQMTLAGWLGEDRSSAYYFSAATDQPAYLVKSVQVQAEFLDGIYTLQIDAGGRVANGYIEKRYYRNGYLLKASEDLGYEVIYTYAEDGWTDYVLVNTAGAVVTKGCVADREGSYYVVKEGSIYKADSALIAPAKAASAFNSGSDKITDSGVAYRIAIGALSRGVYPLTLVRQ